jgi:hypothetical protein
MKFARVADVIRLAQSLVERSRRAAERWPEPLKSAVRGVWRRLPPRDRRFLLQNLESEERRRRVLASPAYCASVRRESGYWQAQAGPSPDRCRWFLAHPTVRRALNRRMGLEAPDF